jgi:hypothetical protein
MTAAGTQRHPICLVLASAVLVQRTSSAMTWTSSSHAAVELAGLLPSKRNSASIGDTKYE